MTLPPTKTMQEADVLAVGSPAPSFDLPASFGRRAVSADLLGKPWILYFYPKADTSGCTRQACEFQESLAALGTGTVPVIGVSRDPMKAINSFAKKLGLQFPLATDEAGEVLAAYGVWVEKSMYGRKYMGIERTTLLVGGDGRIARIWNKVKVPGHAAEVIEAASSLA